MESDILLERDAATATVTLFNPDKLNALNARMWSRLRETFAGLAAAWRAATAGLAIAHRFASGLHFVLIELAVAVLVELLDHGFTAGAARTTRLFFAVARRSESVRGKAQSDGKSGERAKTT